MNQLNSKSLTELQRLVETNNDDITQKKQDIETKRKKVREMRQEQARQQAALAQQNHVSMNNHDQRIYQLKEQLARQQDQIRQIRSNPNITENVSEQLEILRSRLADKQTLLHDATKFYEQITVTLTKNENNSISRHSDRTPIPDALLRPHMTNLNEYLTQEARRVSKAQEILQKRRSSAEKLDAQIVEMKAVLAHQKQNIVGNVPNSATVVPWIQKNNNTLPNSISKRVDIPHGSSSTGSENSGNVRAGSPGGVNRVNLPSYGQIQNQRNQNQNSQIQNLPNQHQKFDQNAQNLKIMNTPIGVKSASDGIVNQNYKLTPQLIQDHYLEQLRGKHYPTPLKKRSSISESLEGLNRHTNTRAGYLFNRQYKSPDTFHPESKKDPPPYPGISPTRQPGGQPGGHQPGGHHRNLAVGGFLTQIDSENDSSNSSPNNSLNKDQQDKAKLVSDKARFDVEKARNLEKMRNEKINEIERSDGNLPQIDETSYAASDLRKRFEKTIENSKSESSKSEPMPSGDNISPKAPPPATPPRTSSTAITHLEKTLNQNSPTHPVDSAIKNAVKNPNPQNSPSNTRNRSPSPPPMSPPKAVEKEQPVPVKSAPKVLRPERSSHKTENPREHKCNHNKRIIFDPFAILLDASLEGEFDLVKQIMKSVPDPSKSNDEGITALHNAVCAGHMKIVELLVHAGVDVNAADSDGWTPLHCAASCNNFQMVKFLVERGACIFAQTMSDRGTAADKCEELDEGYVQCSEYLFGIQEKMGHVQKGHVYALYNYDGCGEIGGVRRVDELCFNTGDLFTISRKTEFDAEGNELDSEWWWAKRASNDNGGVDEEGYVPRNFLGMWPRIQSR
jgi:hypothetical protein